MIHRSWLAGAVALVACRRSPEPPKPEPVPVVSIASVAPASPPAPVASAAPVASSTRGTIACGSGRCIVEKEVCEIAADGKRACVPADKSSGKAASVLECDDRSDCKEEYRQTCCRPTPDRSSCLTADALDSTPCGIEVCNTDEGAAPCPAKQSCVDGVCLPDDFGATCGKTRCSKEKPFCLYSGGGGKCVSAADATTARAAAEADEKAPSIFECTKPSDCGSGRQCCSARNQSWTLPDGIRSTECRFGCDAFKYSDVCEKPADCPLGMSYGANGGAYKQTCKRRPPSKHYPPSTGECVDAAP